MSLVAGSHLQSDVSLRSFNTFGLEVRARWFLPVQHEDTLVEFLIDNPHPGPLMILGGGSNVLFTRDYPGVVIHNQILGREVVWEDDREVVIQLGAGENWHQVVEWTIAQNWGGLENLSLIPGCVGAAPIQNIGAYGVELDSVFESLEAFQISTGRKAIFDRKSCQFGYRDSIFKREAKGLYCITRVNLRLQKPPHVLNLEYGAIRGELQNLGREDPTIADVSRAVMNIRQSKLPDPSRIGNAGSFFKNPEIPRQTYNQLKKQWPEMPAYPVSEKTVKVPAGWLIEKTGWKGFRRDGVGVHDRQALVLVNRGGANGQDLLELSQEIQEAVRQRFHIVLEREVNVVG